MTFNDRRPCSDGINRSHETKGLPTHVIATTVTPKADVLALNTNFGENLLDGRQQQFNGSERAIYFARSLRSTDDGNIS